jgi:hypothetical protein
MLINATYLLECCVGIQLTACCTVILIPTLLVTSALLTVVFVPGFWAILAMQCNSHHFEAHTRSLPEERRCKRTSEELAIGLIVVSPRLKSEAENQVLNTRNLLFRGE